MRSHKTGLYLAALVLVASAAALPQRAELTAAQRDSIQRAREVVQEELGVAILPAVDSFSIGARTIEPGSVLRSSVGLYGGDLTVRGLIEGNVVVVNGNIILAPEGRIVGDVIAVGGQVIREGGALDGAAMSLEGDLRAPQAAPAARSAFPQTVHELGVVVTTLALAIVLGLGVLMLAGGHLAGTAEVLQARPGKSFVVGLLAQLGMLPALVLLVLALALTILGVLLIPFAIVAFFLAWFGLGALGLLAAAAVAGTALSGRGAGSLPQRRKAIRDLLVGIFLFGSAWLLAAALTAVPIVGGAMRAFALVLTWVAATAGLGAALVSRAGQRRSAQVIEPELEPEISWQTPTPVTGVAAARRPVADSTAKR